MKKILISGANGFVGVNLRSSLNEFSYITLGRKGSSAELYWEEINNAPLEADVFIHLAGKAHDLKNVSSPEEYYEANTELTKKIFDKFLLTRAEIFIMLSSVKAAADEVVGKLTEDYISNPKTHYGKSKLLAEEYILMRALESNKHVYILRPCMIYGPGNKGNLNLLYKIVSKGVPWPLGSFNNERSFCSIENLCFVIKELIERKNIPSGIYNVADNESVSTNELIKLIAISQKKKLVIFKIPKSIIFLISKIGDILHLPLNTERLQKLTETYLVSNAKLLKAIGKPLPISTKDGLFKTINFFKNND